MRARTSATPSDYGMGASFSGGAAERSREGSLKRNDTFQRRGTIAMDMTQSMGGFGNTATSDAIA